MAVGVMGRPTIYQGRVLRTVESAIRRLRSLRGAQRELAQKEGPWSENGPSIKTLRAIHRAMQPPVELNDVGGAPRTYTVQQRKEMARLAHLFGVTGDGGAVAIISASNRTSLGKLKNREAFPKPTEVSIPTITEAAKDYPRRR